MQRGSKMLSIHLTDLCNEKCIFCVVGIPERTFDSVVPAKVRRVVEENAHLGYQAVNLHGGEPTVHPSFLNTLELIKENGYPEVHLQTNGRRLRDPELVARLRDLNVKLFIISMHGMDADIHDSLTRTPGGFDQTVQGICHVKASGGFIRTNTVITRQNIHQLPEIVDWLLDLGVDHINISNMHPVETAYLHFDLVTPGVEEISRWVPEAVRRGIGRGAPVTLEGFPFCSVPGCEPYHLGRRDGVIAMEIRGMWIEDYDRFMDEVCRVKSAQCSRCVHDAACGGVYREYIEKRGWAEFSAVPATVPLSSELGGRR
jgi:MoaA/NifB/PqqE/SkfB family radical SAM enzyme